MFILRQHPFSYLGGWDFHCARKLLFRTFLSQNIFFLWEGKQNFVSVSCGTDIHFSIKAIHYWLLKFNNEQEKNKITLQHGRCHLCEESNIQENLQHLFFKCIISSWFISNITILINTLNVGTINLNEKNMMFGFNMGDKHELLLMKDL